MRVRELIHLYVISAVIVLGIGLNGRVLDVYMHRELRVRYFDYANPTRNPETRGGIPVLQCGGRTGPCG